MTIDYSAAQRYSRRKVESIVGPDAADDVLQEAALLAWKKRAQFRGRSKFETYFYRIAVHQALYHLRKLSGAEERGPREFVELPPSLASRAEPQDEQVDRLDRERKLYEAIMRLNRRRKLAALRWLAGETARGAEKAARHKAKVELREMLAW